MNNNNNSLISKNVTIRGRRTSLRLEQESLDALLEISQREGKSFHQICTTVVEQRIVSNRTSAIRTYIINYYRNAATEAGHQDAGHGS